MNGPNPLDYGWWLASRSAGIVALIAVSISVIVGLLMANGLPRRPGAKKRLLAIHESTALTGLVAISVHGLTLLGDAFMHPSVTDIAVPFTMSYRPIFTGLGILAGWLAALLGLSFYVRRRTIGPACGAAFTARRSSSGRSVWSTCSAPGPTRARRGCGRSCSPARCRSCSCSCAGSCRASSRHAPSSPERRRVPRRAGRRAPR